jgi:hypothetical protein
MIMRGKTPRSLGWGGLLAVVGLGLLLLPLLPTKVQSQPPRDERPTDRQPRPVDVDRARDEVKKLEADLDRKRAELKELEARLEQAQNRLAGQDRDKRPEGGRGERVIVIIQGADGRVIRREEVEIGPGGRVNPGEIVLRRGAGLPGVPNLPGVPGGPGGGPRPPLGEGDRRMRDLEKRLDDLMRELESLRREMKSPPPGRGGEGRTRSGGPGEGRPPVPPVPPVPPTPPVNGTSR